MPPLLDMYGHMARYRVLMDLPHSPELQSYFAVDWRPMGNLGIDLLVVPLGRLIGLEPAVKLLVGAIPVLTAAGILLLSRQVHGRITPLAVAAVPLGYSLVFHAGFVNFALGQALALIVLAWWIGTIRNLPPLGRTAILAGCALLVWLCHAAAWGALFLMLGAWELAQARQERIGWPKALGVSCLRLLPSLVPVLAMLGWRGAEGPGPVAVHFFDFAWKASNLRGVLLEPRGAFDFLSLLWLLAMPIAAILFGRARADHRLLVAAALMVLAVLLMPYRLMGSNFADVRFIPLALILLMVSIDPQRLRRPLLAVALLFVAVRLIGIGVDYWRTDRMIAARLPILDLVPRGGSMLMLYGEDCRAPPPPADRLQHFASLVTVRRLAFTNDQFPSGGTPLRIVHRGLGIWADPYRSHVTTAACRPFHTGVAGPVPMTTEQALAILPRGAVDHLLLVRPLPANPAAFAGLDLLADTGDMRLYRVQRRAR